jgi:uncharacterized protein YjbJ (UPF0337 family)
METTKDLLYIRWHEIKDRVRQHWSKLTEEDMARLSGRTEDLAGALQMRYGYGRAQAEMEINDWLRQNAPDMKR